MTTPAFEDCPPNSPSLTPYDQQHLATYLRLIHADKEGADWREAVQIIFGLDPDSDHLRARNVYTSHLARAHWMMETGYQQLLKSGAS